MASLAHAGSDNYWRLFGDGYCTGSAGTRALARNEGAIRHLGPQHEARTDPDLLSRLQLSVARPGPTLDTRDKRSSGELSRHGWCRESVRNES